MTQSHSLRSYCQYHGSHPGISCPECWRESSKEYKRDQEALVHVRRAFEHYFSYPIIGETTLDQIVENCLVMPQVAIYLSPYQSGTVDYYLARYHVVQMIKSFIKRYIDDKLTPQDQEGI